jgi:hypothetical protein
MFDDDAFRFAEQLRVEAEVVRSLAVAEAALVQSARTDRMQAEAMHSQMGVAFDCPDSVATDIQRAYRQSAELMQQLSAQEDALREQIAFEARTRPLFEGVTGRSTEPFLPPPPSTHTEVLKLRAEIRALTKVIDERIPPNEPPPHKRIRLPGIEEPS